jgi:transcriptional regulator with XRE-family HTH domain
VKAAVTVYRRRLCLMACANGMTGPPIDELPEPGGCTLPGPNPTVRQREVGMRLRQHRNSLGLTVEDVAQQLLCSATKISRIETGARRAGPRDVRDLCRLYNLGEADTVMLTELAREARQLGWWAEYTDLNLSTYIGLEDEAIAITAFSMYSFPALLQTTEYAEAIASIVARKIQPGILNLQIEALSKRQELLERDPPPRYRALLDEAVLHRQVGGRAVMVAQLEKVLDLANAGQVTIQIIPFSIGAHGSVDSNFELFEFNRDTLPPVAFVQGLVSTLYQERTSEIDRYRDTADYLRDIALNPRESLKVINAVRLANSGKPNHRYTILKD